MLSFHFLNVGRGDCTILEYSTEDSREFALIDCNRTPSRPSPARSKLEELGAEEVSFVAITHPDTDHYTGILDVLNKWKVRKFFSFAVDMAHSDVVFRKKVMKQLAQLASLHDDRELANNQLELSQILLKAEREFKFGENWEQVIGNYAQLAVPGFVGVNFFGFLPPLNVRGSFKDAVTKGEFGGRFPANNLSFALLVEYGEVRIVLGGDVVGENWDYQEKYESKTRVSTRSTASKVPHHGSRYDCNSSYLRCVFGDRSEDGQKERLAVISANGTTHPHFETMNLFRSYGVQTYCTNLPRFFRETAQRLLTDPRLDPVFLSTLNIHAESASQISQPCKGDITITVAPDGKLMVRPQYSSVCPCTPP